MSSSSPSSPNQNQSQYAQKVSDLVESEYEEGKRVNPYLTAREEDRILRKQTEEDGMSHLTHNLMKASPTNSGENDRSFEEALSIMEEWKNDTYNTPTEEDASASTADKAQKKKKNTSGEDDQEAEQPFGAPKKNLLNSSAEKTDAEMNELATQAIEKIRGLGVRFYRDFRSKYGGNLGLSPNQTAVAFCKYHIATLQGKSPYKKHLFTLSGFGLNRDMVEDSYSPYES